MARAGGGGGGAEPRQRRERSRSREESKARESMSSSTGMGNRHPVFLDGEAMKGVGILGGKGTRTTRAVVGNPHPSVRTP